MDSAAAQWKQDMADEKKLAEKRLQIMESRHNDEQLAAVREELDMVRHLEERPFCV
jgi:hypothetical protein